MKFYNYINESINDKGILKSIVMCGTPGSGKSFTISRIKGGDIPIKIVNTDI
jgi:GTPase SAR1 family protein